MIPNKKPQWKRISADQGTFLCRIFWHKWKIDPDYSNLRECERCGECHRLNGWDDIKEKEEIAEKRIAKVAGN